MKRTDLPRVTSLVAELDGCRLLLQAIEKRDRDVWFRDVHIGSVAQGWIGDVAPSNGVMFRGDEIIPALRAAVARLEGELRSLGVLL